jgi:hypothetical protein
LSFHSIEKRFRAGEHCCLFFEQPVCSLLYRDIRFLLDRFAAAAYCRADRLCPTIQT